ncbi:unnamed protein product [Sympodiomycopsis kandeliae]
MITITSADNDNIYPLDCDPDISVGDVKALLEADSSIPSDRQHLYFNAVLLSDASKTLKSYGVSDDDMILLRDAGAASASNNASQRASRPQGQQPQSDEQAAEMLRQQALADPNLMAQLRSSNPQLADAAANNSQEFTRMMMDIRRHVSQAENERARAEAELAAADEFDPEAQRRIEEAIQKENVMQNLEHAMEFNPESFGSIHMLYVNTEVNGVPVKAFVDSGAQATIMSPDCAERCGIMRLLDTRFAGIARGVGTAKILGRVHSAQLKLSNSLFLPCSFTIMEGKGVECLFGLDMLKRYQASIDLRENALIINGEKCRFLDEHELPASAKEFSAPEGEEAQARSNADSAAQSGVGGQSIGSAPTGFPGSGQALGGDTSSSASAPKPTPAASTATTATSALRPAPATSATGPHRQPQQARGQRTFPPESIKALTDLGASESQARSLLEAAGGNVEVAAGLLFQGN